ncbi:putative pentatricopeptide repeat-containing protein At5g37570 [Humulus lupulus]|uniref:putative pentatricopeptide repeat-containing protein At5g37570 n=1 Tax=Humulus lupulus TaxID=3486 RepID=UPI002B40866C|nr:putative pentatricopeptide repeat-containing protein At5g37570 [Humulus lupulus]
MPVIRPYPNFLLPNNLPNSFLSIPALIKACKTPTHLQLVHAHIVRRGLEQDHSLISQFIGLSQALSTLSYSASVFDRVFSPNTFLWNVFIKGCCQKSCSAETVSVFIHMKREEAVPDRYTYPSVIKACASEGKIREGRTLHGSVLRCGVECDAFVSTSLIDLYGKCKEIGCARKLFDYLFEKNVVTWTAMVVGYVIAGDLGEARKLFDEMPQRNVASWNAIIGGFVKLGDLGSARKIFEEMAEKNVVSFTTLIDGYAKSGDMASARVLFDRAPYRDIVAWSALISGYAQNGQAREVVNIFIEMDSCNVKPDEFIMVSLMSACSQEGCLELAKWVDNHVTRSSVDLGQVHVLAALVDMNAKCGNIERAKNLFEQMPKHDLISYCSLMQGLSIHGCGEQAVSLFHMMLNEGLIPDEVGFSVILTACSRSGLVEDGRQLFHLMKNEYSIAPSQDHYACMVDLLSRSGRLKEAYEILSSMPMEPSSASWGALLGACKLHCDVELGELVASRLIELEPQNAGNYVLLSNIYAATDRWLDVSLVRRKMREKSVKKIPGRSWIRSHG